MPNRRPATWMLLAVWLPLAARVSLGTGAARAADWHPPADNLFTEKQLMSYLQVQKQALDNWKAAGKAVDGSQSAAAAMALALNADEKFKASLVAHDLQPDEYSWVGTKVWQAYSAITLEGVVERAKSELDRQKRSGATKLAALKQSLADAERADRAGHRVLTAAEREQAVQTATEDRKTALDEADRRGEEAAQARREALQAEQDAKAADAAASNPPEDVAADDRDMFIEGKRTEAGRFRDTAKEARDRETEAARAQAEAQSRARADAARIREPDLPPADDDPADVKKENAERIAALKTEISDTEKSLKMLDDSAQSLAKVMNRPEADKAPRANVDLLKKHLVEFQSIVNFKTEAAK